MDIGREEDQWDSLIAQDLGLEAENTSISWSEAPADALQEVKRARAREIEKRMTNASARICYIRRGRKGGFLGKVEILRWRGRLRYLQNRRLVKLLFREVLFEFENAEEAEISFPLLPPPVDVDVPARFEQLKSRDRTVDEDAVTSTPAKDLHPAQRESTESLFRDSSDDRRDRQFLHFAAQINEFKETALPYLTHEGSMGPEAFIPNEAHVARKLIRKASYTPRIPRIQTESSEEEAFRASGSPHLTQWRRISLNLPRHNNKSAKRRLRRHRNAKIWAARWANYADRFKNTQLIEHRPMDFIVALAEATLTPALSKRKMQERLWNLGAETRKFKEEAELARSEREAIDKAHEEGVSTVRRLIGGAKGSSSK
ncbi:uncharacterized protein KY384_009242 [Bacidia gigantensis]|uniref:uncharacterized protein n=1 Tax=Bacidia gigantensis TaxID=2732470 RepID=UPI001D04D15C|nr:uncharacterized protein KY384_009242 [Bacidia gigantensis]KAG8525598.1 hypothetical protein KY384_009242 [Bacidia gigantensis]